MKSLQIFLNENLENHIVNEGKIWDAIKDWFKKLFEPSDREFDRYNVENKISGSNLANYKKYLNENFDVKNLKLKPITKKDLKNVVYPNGEEPNEDGEIGFYNFIDNINDKKDNTEYFVYVYEDIKVKDTSCIINCIYEGKKIELLKIQILKEFSTLLPIKRALELLFANKEFKKDSTQVVFKENTDKSFYKQLINDSEFESQYDKENNQNIAIKNI